ARSLQWGGRVRGRLVERAAVAAEAGLPGGRPGDRREAVRIARGHLRPVVRGAVRAGDLRRGPVLRGECRHAPAGRRPMRRETQNILLVLLGGALLKIGLNGDYLRYVKPAQHPWVLAGGAVILALGAIAIVRDLLSARA